MWNVTVSERKRRRKEVMSGERWRCGRGNRGDQAKTDERDIVREGDRQPGAKISARSEP